MKKRSVALALSISISVTLVGVMPALPARAGCCPAMWVLQAIPGRSFDLCIDGVEVRSNFNYKQSEPIFGPGERQVLLTKPAPGADCSGPEVFRRKVDSPSPHDVVHTLAAGLGRNGAPRLFDVPTSVGSESMQRVMFRHVAAAGPVDVLIDGVAVTERVRNGDRRRLYRGGSHTIMVVRHDDGQRLAGPRVIELPPFSDSVVEIFFTGNRRVGYSMLTITQECLPCA